MSIEIILYRIVIVGLGFIVYMAYRKIKWQDKDILRLLKDAAQNSNNLRLKGVEVDVLRKRIKKAERDFHIRIVG